MTLEFGGTHMSRYAVVDIETTGLSPARNHRIVEVAVTLVDDDGNPVYEWETLVNPVRDVGATEVHGISAADVYSAPTFDQIAGELVSLLKGRVLVAHNLSFDAPFLAAEFAHAGYVVGLDRSSGLCTMRLASYYLPTRPRALGACCSCIGYSIDGAHCALDDARAAARLLAYYIKHDEDFLETWSEEIAAAHSIEWPSIPVQATKRVTRQLAAKSTEEHFLARLVSRTPRCNVCAEAGGYLEVLDGVLLDRRISRHEADELVAVAEAMRLSRQEALAIHQSYLTALARLATADGMVTCDERADLVSVASLLGLPASAVDQAIDSALRQENDSGTVGRFALRPGDRVVFTGEARGMSRSDLECQARALGLCVGSSVSRDTSLVVAADPDSLSGKARKARSLGIPIVDYPTYFRMIRSV